MRLRLSSIFPFYHSLEENKKKTYLSIRFCSVHSKIFLSTMNDSFYIYTYPSRANHLQSIDRLLSFYSLLLIFIGTPCNLLCCAIYFQKHNRSNSIKTIFGYLAFLDTFVPFTFNLNYVFREFNLHIQITYFILNQTINDSNRGLNSDDNDNLNAMIFKKNLEEYSLIICRFLSYFGKNERKKKGQSLI